MEMFLLWGALLLFVGWIVLRKYREMEADAAASGAAIDVHEAMWVKAIACTTSLTEQEAAALLADGMPAGEIVSTWDAERSAYCFRCELPDGSAPMYFTAEFAPTAGGTRLTLTRQKTLLHGRRDSVMWLPGYLKAKLGATDFHWTKDEGYMRRGGIR